MEKVRGRSWNMLEYEALNAPSHQQQLAWLKSTCLDHRLNNNNNNNKSNLWTVLYNHLEFFTLCQSYKLNEWSSGNKINLFKVLPSWCWCVHNLLSTEIISFWVHFKESLFQCNWWNTRQWNTAKLFSHYYRELLDRQTERVIVLLTLFEFCEFCECSLQVEIRF